MTSGLTAVALRNLGERKGRTLLTAGGIVLGVALFVGALIAAATTTEGIDTLAREAAGQADVIVAPAGGVGTSLLSPIDGADISEGDIARLAGLPDVAAAGGVVAFPTVIETDDGRRTTLELNQRTAQASLVGADLGAGTGIFPVRLQDGRLPAAAGDEIAVPVRLADDLGIATGDAVTVATPTGDRRVVVSGLLASEGVGRLSTVAFTTVDAAQRLGGRPEDKVSFAALELAPGTDVDAWVDTHEHAAGPGLHIAAAGEVGDRFRAQLGMLSAVMTVLAAAVLFSAGFLIHLTLSMSVVERTRLYGTFHALGATPRQVRRVVLLEALGMGAVATMVGIAVGVGVAFALNAATSRFLTIVGSPPVQVTPWALLGGAAFGLVTTVVSALLPARQASLVEPVAAMRDPHAVPSTVRTGWRLGAVALVGGTAALLTSATLGMQVLGLVAVLGGATRLVAPLIAPLAGLVRRAVRRVSPGTGDLAVLHLASEPSRSAGTLSLVMLVMAITFATGAITVSYIRSLEREIDRTFTNDLTLSAASTFDSEFVAAVEEHPAVDAVTPISRATTFLVSPSDRDYVYVQVIDPATYFDMAGYLWTDGDDTSARRLLERGRAMILPEPVAERLGVGVGGSVVVETSDGDVAFEVAALARISNLPPMLVTGTVDGARYFGVDRPLTLAVNVSPGTDLREAARALEEDLAGRGTFIVNTSDDLRADARAQILGVSNGFFVLLLLAGFVGLFGLANTLAVSIIQRGREIGVLRAIGARRAQVAAMAVVEAMTLVLVAFVLAVPLGALISGPLMDATSSGLGDFDAPYVFPWAMVPVVAGIGLVVGGVAAAWPARRAAGTEIDLALRFE